MGILDNLRARVQGVEEGLRSGALIRDTISRHGTDIWDLQQEQLLTGKTPRGKDIRPYYSEDLKPAGYFHSRESAGRYAAWKQSLDYPYTVGRNPDAPNLYITGKFHGELEVFFGADSVAVLPGTPYAKNIVAKYGLGTFGLSPGNWERIWEYHGAYRELMDDLRARLYG